MLRTAGAIAATCLAWVSLGAGQATSTTLTVVRPSADEALTGEVTLEAAVLPETISVRAVTFFVDGQQACRATERPFQCHWDAGLTAVPRNIRVTAELGDGRRLVRTIRTVTPPPRNAFRAAVHMVLVPVYVTDNRGRFVQGLTASDFRVSEDGTPQEAELVRTGERPASVLLALDVSSSMDSTIQELRRSAAAFLRALSPEDAIIVAAFNEDFHVLLRSGASPEARLEALERLKPSGATALYDGIIRAVDILSSLPPPRAIVMFTDGEDTRSRSLESSVRVALQRNDVVLYLIAQSAEPSGALREHLAPLATETGGIAWFPTQMTAVVEHFVDVVRYLRNQYVLAYPSPLPGSGWRRITVTLTDDRGRNVRSREGYMARDDGSRR
jgi:VWFA-related protein